MKSSFWQLQNPLDAILFDCESTLTTIEGIDLLATQAGVGEQVKQLTAAAMGTTGINPEIYQKRLDLIHPTREQILAIGNEYCTHPAEDALAVIQLLQKLKKTIYIISAGFYPAVAIFAKFLKIPEKNIFAVDVKFDAQDNLLDFDRKSPLIHNDGKRIIVTEIKKTHPQLAFVGDGLNDYSTHDLVTRFIGFGGIAYREKVAGLCDFYIKSPSLSALLPLLLTQDEVDSLNANEKALYQKGKI